MDSYLEEKTRIMEKIQKKGCYKLATQPYFFPICIKVDIKIIICMIFYVLVLNVNDNPPKFSQISYRCWLSEEASRGQLVMAVVAYDIDFDVLYYNIVSGNEHQAFNIHQFTGTYYFFLIYSSIILS